MLYSLFQRGWRRQTKLPTYVSLVHRVGWCDGSVRLLSSITRHVEIDKLLVANRGEIACRVIATADKLGIPTVAVYSDADRNARHVQMAQEAFNIGPPPAAQSYLLGSNIIDVAKKCGATAVHPGYGFLSEDGQFARQCKSAGITFVGPPADAMEKMGDKSQAKSLMRQAGVPVVPGYEGEDQSIDRLCVEGSKIGYPLLVKAVMGGGGKGMKLVQSESDLEDAIKSAQREAASSFGDDRVLLERFIQCPRHIEVQVFADLHGNTIHLLERDCSVQRRHQKILEESPAPHVTQDFRDHIGQAAVDAARTVGYVSAGTVEFILDTKTDEFFFMEMNTRLQVEHPVSEWVCGVDLVEWQLRVAAGEKLPLQQDQITPRGHAIEARLYAEVPLQNFLPGTGTVQRWKIPDECVEFRLPDTVSGMRVDSGVQAGNEVGTNYDPMIAKVIAGGADRAEALANLEKSLKGTQVVGLPTNLSFLLRALSHSQFAAGEVHTGFIETHKDELLETPQVSEEFMALAAVARLKLSSFHPASSGAPWDILDGRRLNHCLEETMEMKTEGREMHSLSVTCLTQTAFRVTGDNFSSQGLPVTNVAFNSDGSLSGEVNGERYMGHAALFNKGGEAGVCLWMNGQQCEFTWPIPKWDGATGSLGSSSGRISAPMPGKVVKVFVKNGDEVAQGAALVVLEAMKMEHTVSAPISGKVGDIRVRPGGRVEDGSNMLQIEPVDAA